MTWNDVQQCFTSTPPTTRANTTYADMHSFSKSRMILTLKISKGYKDKHFEKQNKSRNGCSTAKMTQIHRLDLVFHFECRMAEPTPRTVASSFLLLSKCTYTNRSTSFLLFCPYLNLEHSQIRLFAVLTKKPVLPTPSDISHSRKLSRF